MPADFEKCVKDGGRVRTMKLKDGKYMHVCYDKGGKSHVGEVKKKKEGVLGFAERVRWCSDVITEALADRKDMVKIRGTAIKARESRNGVTYEMAELSKAKPSLMGKTIALNHSENAEDTVGIIEDVQETIDGLEYSGIAHNTGRHPYIIELLQKGLIRHVSIEATAPQIEEKEGRKIARNLEFLGLAFVRHPGIPEASAGIAEALEKMDDEDWEVDDTDEAESLKKHEEELRAFIEKEIGYIHDLARSFGAAPSMADHKKDGGR